MEIDMGVPIEIYGTVTQGRSTYQYPQRVESYRVEVWLCDSACTWTEMLTDAQTSTFTGNTDRNTQVRQRFSDAVKTRYVKFVPLTWNIHISMRAGVLIEL